MTTNTASPAATVEKSFNADHAQAQARLLLQDSARWIADNWLQVLIALGIGSAIVLVLLVLRRWGMKLARDDRAGWGSVAGRAIGRTGLFFMVMLAAKLVDGYASAPPMVTTTIEFLFTVAAVFQAAIWAREVILGAVERRTASDHYHGEALASAMGLIRLLVTFALFAIALIVVLDNLGVNVTGLVAGLGVGGIAIGLAAQGIFADLFAALSIIFDKPFRRGDNVSYDQTNGSIAEIGLKSTRIRSVTGEERIISNKNLLDKEITNNTRRSHRRASFAIGVTYQTDAETCARIPAILREVVEAEDRVFVRCGLTGFGASSIDFELLFDSSGADYVAFYDGRTAVGIAILRRFAAEGIEIAYPTQVNFNARADGTIVDPVPAHP
ncbi:mechanosensitive ion channel family protein [Sphingomonas hankookensis]|uniref:mechanosensitive ion channel family protein n=1 Tax=Sphingomonas hankookensis TaxID=563996 RepID=UPI001F5A14D4|nr:mechanosensitive ion channel family protein [Sphingomonas hankookensis]